VSEQVSATYAILGEARRHFGKAMGADSGEAKQVEREAPVQAAQPAPQPTPHPKPQSGNQVRTPVNGTK
jgi:biotin carboxyl carrier protein